MCRPVGQLQPRAGEQVSFFLINAASFLNLGLAGFGALYPNYDTDNMAEIPTSFGGLVFMMAAVSYLGGVVILLAWPVYRFLLLQFETPGVTAGVLPLVLGASGALALTAVCIVMPLRAGVAKVRKLER